MDNLVELESKMGVVFKDKLLLRTALTHSSYAKQKANRFLVQDNERLEFLGDAVLKLLASRYLFKRYPRYLEGQLTKIRAKLVSDKNLYKLALQLDLGKYILFSFGEKNTGGAEKISNLANAFEAVLGACYLDQGIDAVQQFFETLIDKNLDDFLSEEQLGDYKTQLQEFFQRKKMPLPIYTVTHIEGPDHQKIFYIKVTIEYKGEGQDFFGTGHSKKEGEQSAAKSALEALNQK